MHLGTQTKAIWIVLLTTTSTNTSQGEMFEMRRSAWWFRPWFLCSTVYVFKVFAATGIVFILLYYCICLGLLWA